MKRKRQPTVTGKGPRPVDVHVGQRLRLRRTLLGMSQINLGDAVGISFQQIQKYERGANRVSASRLYQLGNVLGVDINYFYDEMPSAVSKTGGGFAIDKAGCKMDKAQAGDLMARRETLEFVRAYYKINEAGARKKLFELVKAIASVTE